MFEFLKKLFCHHNNNVYVRTVLDRIGPGEYRTHHIWKCSKCGKECD